MKKPYNKPRMYAETFELVEHIANCAVKSGSYPATYRDRTSCSYTDGDVTLFNNTGVNGCTNNIAPFFGGNVDAFLDSLNDEDAGCYNAFSNGNVFAS